MGSSCGSGRAYSIHLMLPYSRVEQIDERRDEDVVPQEWKTAAIPRQRRVILHKITGMAVRLL